MGGIKNLKNAFAGKKRKSHKRRSKGMESPMKRRLEEYNKNESWFKSFESMVENVWNDDEESSSRRKIILPEEDICFDSEDSCYEYDEDDECNVTDVGRKRNWSKPYRNLIIDSKILEQFIQDNCVCKDCGRQMSVYEDSNQHHGLGTKLDLFCQNSCERNGKGFFTTKKPSEHHAPYDINRAVCIGMRAIGRGYSSALKLFSIIGLGPPVSNNVWTKYTSQITDTARVTAEKNMKLAAEDVFNSALMNGKVSNEKASVGVSFDCSWNSRGWQAKQGVVAAIAQDNGKIVDIVHKVSYCRECKQKQDDRDKKKITGLEYIEWFLEHEIKCSLNHTGSPQVSNYQS